METLDINENISSIEELADDELDSLYELQEEVISTLDDNTEVLDTFNDVLEVSNDNEHQIQVLDSDIQFSVIKNYGENLTEKEYITNPAIERDNEINEMILALITPDKGAILTGKAGIGKTAIVEGLAYRIQKGEVPDALKNWQIIKINITSLLGSTTENGNTDSRLEILLKELKMTKDIILFIDEVHLLVNKATSNNNIDFANMLKPYLDRGTIKMIGATTTEEYEAYILRDRAFLRRFIKIDIKEADTETVVKILMGTYPKYEKQLNVKMAYTDFQKENIFRFLTEMTSEYKRVYEISARYPDITLTLVANAFSYAVFENAKEVRIKHFYKAVCNAKNIYPDTLKKEIARFKVEFKTMLEDEEVDLDDI